MEIVFEGENDNLVRNRPNHWAQSQLVLTTRLTAQATVKPMDR